MIGNNPFTSNTFVKTWTKHFKVSVANDGFETVQNLKFYKPYKYLPIYINIGKHLTKGVSYFIKPFARADYKKKLVLIYDVPQYFDIATKDLPEKLGFIKIKQYPGYSTQLNNYKNFEDYIATNFSKKSKYKFKSYTKKLEALYDISYVNYDYTTSKTTFDAIFNRFYDLLKKRFEDKSESNNNLNPEEWAFYQELVYLMMKNKQASLFAVLDKTKPIAISLNYFSDHILFFAMTGFDIHYKAHNLGTVHLMALFKWCFANHIKIFDFSKGHYDYKARWGDTKYYFEQHIYYDSSSPWASVTSRLMGAYFKIKQRLRDAPIRAYLNKIKFKLKRN
ncbi:GNAT family N-acetyltransferase [Tamlana fucoidanivorans]|uniref:GNAT family N-acetyltransferase n=1 Tax=Allotamlana fucoidanivorans TaxID=2583814 RepID=UPI0013053C92|nr:GNAT family N-acetyltransferase [Tamlana fucoidanivorans]